MHIVLVPFGSHGDVHPFIGLGQVLKSRGHRVTFLQPEYFGPLLKGLGFDVVTFGEPGQYEREIQNPDLWHPTKAFPSLVSGVLQGTKYVYEYIAKHYKPGEMVAVGGSLALGVRLAHDKLGIPAATVHVQPGVLHSNERTPNYGGLDTNRWPKWLKRAFYQYVFSKLVDPHIAPALNTLRAELGLRPVKDVMRSWMHSPELVLGFFPGLVRPTST